MVASFICEEESGLRLRLRIFHIPVVQVEKSVVQVHAAQSMMIPMLFIDGLRLAEFGQCLIPQLLKSTAIRRLVFAVASPAARSGLPAAFCVCIDLAPQLQRDEPLDVGHIVERPGYIAMLRIELAVKRNRGCETLDGVLITPLAAGDPPIGGMDVAQSEIVVRLAQNGFCRLQNLESMIGIALLEKEPALEYSHNRRHRRVTQFPGEVSALYRERQGLVVLALHAQAAALPEIGDREQFLIIRLLFETEDKFEVLNGFVR